MLLQIAVRMYSKAVYQVQELGAVVMFYMAAAVSDFYVPWELLPEHKIQSSGGTLDLQLSNVPKCLGLLTGMWCPQAYHVSFKLETDKDLLERKARGAIDKNGVHCVVANMLDTRKDE